MKQNKYDDEIFFEKYSHMDRSVKGLSGAGEWETLKRMLPDFQGKRVLDLGCGFGWHCQYAMENGAASAVGVDISEKIKPHEWEKLPWRWIVERTFTWMNAARRVRHSSACIYQDGGCSSEIFVAILPGKEPVVGT